MSRLPCEPVEVLHPPTEAIQRIARGAAERDILTPAQSRELIELFGEPPGAGGSGFDDEQAERFVRTTLQLIEVCLREAPAPQEPLINDLLQEALTELCAEQGGSRWVLTRAVCDAARRGTDRRFTFGQIKEVPADPSAPSFFGGAWVADCDGEPRKIVFVLTAEVIPESIRLEPIPAPVVERERLRERLEARGPASWQLQVEPGSDLGRWIAGLTGTPQIGQHLGYFPLGVLCDAVRRGLETRGVSHLLLGPSRRDAPTRPWHTGAFLRRIDRTGDFTFTGEALHASSGDSVVTAHCTVRMKARILSLRDV